MNRSLISQRSTNKNTSVRLRHRKPSETSVWPLQTLKTLSGQRLQLADSKHWLILRIWSIRSRAENRIWLSNSAQWLISRQSTLRSMILCIISELSIVLSVRVRSLSHRISLFALPVNDSWRLMILRLNRLSLQRISTDRKQRISQPTRSEADLLKLSMMAR